MQPLTAALNHSHAMGASGAAAAAAGHHTARLAVHSGCSAHLRAPLARTAALPAPALPQAESTLAAAAPARLLRLRLGGSCRGGSLRCAAAITATAAADFGGSCALSGRCTAFASMGLAPAPAAAAAAAAALMGCRGSDCSGSRSGSGSVAALLHAAASPAMGAASAAVGARRCRSLVPGGGGGGGISSVSVTASSIAQRQRQLATHAGAAEGASSLPPSKKQRKQAAKPKQPQPQPQGQPQQAPSPGQQPPPPPPQQQATPAAPSVRYSPLHYNIEDFAARVVPTEGERRQRVEVVEAVRAGVRKVWPGARSVEVEVFGSFANGLSTWASDVDLVITGVMEPDRASGGYEPADRARITARLRKVAEALSRGRAVEVVRSQLIPRARIPILKLWTRGRVCVDVSLSDDSGPRAARYMAQQCRAFPPLRPLVLVVKTYLKACRLNEVNTGGLSSYSLTNMVIAHLQEELKSGHDISDLGETLYTFLLRFGEEHDYANSAVSVASGGVVPKSSLGFAMESARQAAASMGSYDGAVSWAERLCVDCPLTGRDVSNGTYRIDLVRSAFVQAARKLEALAYGRRITDNTLNYLQALFDVQRVLRRSHPDPFEQQPDPYLTVIGRAGAADSEAEEEGPLVGGNGGGEEGGEGEWDDEGGDYLERPPTTAAGTAAAAAARQQQQGGGRR